MATNSVVPIPKPPRARASIAGPLAERTPGVEVSERERVDEVTDQLWSHTWLNFQVRAGEFTHVRPRTQMGRPVSQTSHLTGEAVNLLRGHGLLQVHVERAEELLGGQVALIAADHTRAVLGLLAAFDAHGREA